MNFALHSFHIPVMGTGFTVDTPIRVAPFGISSVISLVDDLLLERVREHYCGVYSLPYERIPRRTEDGRAKRITAYLDTVGRIVKHRFEEIRSMPFGSSNDKARYFEMLPDDSPLRQAYFHILRMPHGPERSQAEQTLTQAMQPGSIDVNIMVKLDRIERTAAGAPLSEEFSDAKAALRGYANSDLDSCIVFSAGINQALFNYMAQFRGFYRDAVGNIRKKIVLKVSDFRSAMIQGKFLARKGLEVHEFRIESGLNCGGHAFASAGHLLPSILREIREKRDSLVEQFRPMVLKYYRSMGWDTSSLEKPVHPFVTVQGGIGTHGEDRRMREVYGMDRTGWASPFLLVPEATPVDDMTRDQLALATEDDLYLSDASPLGVPFNNLRRSGSEQWQTSRIESGTPGSPCPKGFLVSNTEFTDAPICTASRQYQQRKLEELDNAPMDPSEREAQRKDVLVKACICDHLGNSALIALGVAKPGHAPQAICPGPNVAWFNRIYSLSEMVDHIYGRIPSLVPASRPHMFCKETQMYVDHFLKRSAEWNGESSELTELREIAHNISEGMDYILEIASGPAYPDENLAGIPMAMEAERKRLLSGLEDLNTKATSMLGQRVA